MTTNGQHPGAGLVDPAHVIPAPPPAPTAMDGARTYPGVHHAVAPAPPAAQPQPQPAPQPVAAAQPAPVAPDGAKARKQQMAIIGVIVVGALALPAYRWVTRDRGPSAETIALRTQVSALQAEAAATASAQAVEVNPLNVMPCAVTNDARRFIGVTADGSLALSQSLVIAKAVQEHLRQGTTDYGVFVVRTGTSVSQLEVDTKGRGVQLFDCGRPAVAAPSTTVPAQTQTTGGR